MSGHTAGPWLRDKYGNVTNAAGDRIAFRSVTVVCSGPRERISEAEANTDLATAAPDLLDALEEAVKDLVAVQINARAAARYDGEWSGVSEAIQPSVDRARAAIDKARTK